MSDSQEDCWHVDCLVELDIEFNISPIPLPLIVTLAVPDTGLLVDSVTLACAPSVVTHVDTLSLLRPTEIVNLLLPDPP